jgi:hypothetical protein
MAEPVEYIITIRLDGEGGESRTDKKTPDTANKPNGDNPSGKNAKEKDKKKAIAKGISAYHYAKSAADIAISSQINTIELRTGRSQLQARMQTSYDIGKRIWNIGESIAIGAMLGGGVPGAVIGAVGSIASQGISLALEQYNLDLQKTVDDIGLKQMQIRAGTGGNRVGRNSG